MKNIKIAADHFFSMLGICILTSTGMYLVNLAPISSNSQWGFYILILIIGALINVVLAAHFTERQLQTVVSENEKNLRKDNEIAQKALAEQKSANEELKKKLASMPVYSKKNLGLNSEKLIEKCNFLEQFRDSFPLRIADGYRIYNMIRIEFKPGLYSRWIFVGESGNQLWILEVLRPDTQTYKELLQLASATKSPEEIQGLNLTNTALWM